MRHLGQVSTALLCMTFLVAGSGMADACNGKNKTGKRASASAGCSSTKSSCSASKAGRNAAACGVSAQASADKDSSCAPGCVKQCCAGKADGQTLGTSTFGGDACNVQLLQTSSGFRIYSVGCKATGRGLLEKSATVLNSRHSLKSEIFEAKDGLYMDVNGGAATSLYKGWMARARTQNSGCLLTTEEGECRLGTGSLAAAG